ncbi:MFS transporter [Promethearchaeum syntrophicum]|uniref:MFS transporter n=1 Tax=Promethearchaeum syntrophicum TaxID=2594042 RepID=A0A5B9D9E3_9ARCH|nr:MFS transporter [Candidatus Prometheoarchaeum syntrophicum]QEE15206.1 Major Facilitator Superfamily protein [Candidatus Prometheoarchaeum syntrophicum]
MSKLNQFLQINKLPKSLQKISRFYVVITMMQSIAFHITDTFLVLYLLETHTWAQVSIIFSVQMVTQLIFDYPTGILGDWIGQKKILLSAFLFLSSANLCILLSESFVVYVLFGILSGLGNSQFSGALDAWYDSQYTRHCSQIDPSRKIYGLFQGRVYSLYLGIAGLSILASGLIANNFSRQILFILQITVYIIMAVGIGIGLKSSSEDTSEIFKNYNGKIPDQEPKENYFSILLKGLKFVFSQKKMWLFFFGIAIYNAFLDSVWTKLILFPLYNQYALSDTLTGVIRWVNLTIDVFLVGILAKYSSQTQKKEMGYILSLAGMLVCLIFVSLFYILLPPTEIFIFGRYFGIWLISLLMATPYRLTWLFYSRIIIDLVPNQIRNSIYSFIPSLILLLAIPANMLGGFIIDGYGFVAGILLVVGFATIGVLFQLYSFKLKKT